MAAAGVPPVVLGIDRRSGERAELQHAALRVADESLFTM
jgi:hypothetical protein